MTTNTECEIILDKTKKHISEIETKDIYRLLIDKKSKRPTSENKWQENDLLDICNED
jgi:hypothetical protein